MARGTTTRAPARKTTRKKTSGARAGARKPPARRKPKRRSDAVVVDRRFLADVGGIALFAVGLFSALVMWVHVGGGPLGSWLALGLRGIAGRAGIVLPAALLLLGGALVVYERLPRPGHRGIGVALVAAGILLGLSTGATTGPEARAAGGLVGGVLNTLVAGAAGQLGVTFVVGLFVLAGASVLSGVHPRVAFNWLHEQLLETADALRSLRSEGELDDYDDTYEPETPAKPARAPRAAKAAAVAVAPGMSDDGSRFPEPFVRDDDLAPAQTLLEAQAASAATSDTDPPWEDTSEPTVESTDNEWTGNEHTSEPPTASVADEDALGRIAQHSDYVLPEPTTLRQSTKVQTNTAGQERVGRALVDALASHGVEARIVGTVSGPRITRYEIQLAPGTKVNRVSHLKDDLAYALATTDIRILAPIPGKQAVGVEVPNLSPNMVTLGDIVAPFPASVSPLAVWLGQDIAGQNVWTDLAKMPHVLIAGTTGSGKSGCLNAMLVSILLNATPEECKLILIDPKKVELNHYEAIPHLLTPVVTNMKGASAVLMNCVAEMERRYDIMGAARARNISELNKLRRAAGREMMPYVLVVIDELADLMMVAPAEVEDSIIRLAQKSRAVGIHLVLATQRPSVDVITGMIKANVPSRIAFAVSSMTDSRVIMDTPGAESLLGQGDMLFRPLGTSRVQRIQGAYVTEEEIAAVVAQCRRQGEPEFVDDMLELPDVATVEGRGEDELDPDADDLLDEAIRLVVQHETASVSLVQRRLRVGYTRAGRLIDMLERRGVISGYEGSKPRQVLIAEGDVARYLTTAPKPAQAERTEATAS